MGEQYLGELRIMAFGTAPRGWAPCNGQTLPISGYQALFSLLGTYYGGDGVSTFRLPNLQGQAPLGCSPSLPLGVNGGTETVQLGIQHMPVHNHALMSDSSTAATSNLSTPGANALGQTAGSVSPGGGVFDLKLYGTDAPSTPMAATAISSAGGSAAHENRQPYLGLNICIALNGIYPSRP